MAGEKRVIRVSRGTLHRDLGGESVLLQLDMGQYFGLDEIAQRAWQLILEHDGDLDRVRIHLLSEYDVDSDALAADLDHFVDELVASKLVEVRVLASSEDAPSLA
jgi:Coenzyme PQQ synthesis protein D (PqqD)